MDLQKENLPKFECKISNKLLNQFLDIVKNSHFTSFKIDVRTKGFKFNQMDSSHVSLLKGRIDIQSFEYYNVSQDGSFGFDPIDLKNALKVFGKKDILSITCDIENKLVISTNEFTVEYRLFDLYVDYTSITPSVYLDTEFYIIDKKKFYNGMLKAMNASDYIIFHVLSPTKNMASKVNFILKNHDEKKALQRVSFTANTQFYHYPETSFKIAFYMEFLVDLFKYLPEQKIFFKMGKGMPLLIEANLDSYSHMKYWLAPRISDKPGEFD